MNRPPHSSSHVVLIPSYNTGDRLVDTVRDALSVWCPVWVIVDGSTDGSSEKLQEFAREIGDEALRVLVLPENVGKGAAVLHGAELAKAERFTHILTMDADGQHPFAMIPEFMALSEAEPDAMILGDPVFGKDAPSIRVNGRKISNFWANLETLWAGIHDSLFGFRLYPLEAFCRAMHQTRFARRFDFDVEVAVRLCWLGVPVRNEKVPVRYFTTEEGGVSQFRYFRDNTLLTWMHARLLAGFFRRLPRRVLSPASAGNRREASAVVSTVPTDSTQ